MARRAPGAAPRRTGDSLQLLSIVTSPFRVFSTESSPHACSEVKRQRKPHEPALKDVLRLTEARSERLPLLEQGSRRHDVEERAHGRHLSPLHSQSSLSPPP